MCLIGRVHRSPQHPCCCSSARLDNSCATRFQLSSEDGPSRLDGVRPSSSVWHIPDSTSLVRAPSQAIALHFFKWAFGEIGVSPSPTSRATSSAPPKKQNDFQSGLRIHGCSRVSGDCITAYKVSPSTGSFVRCSAIEYSLISVVFPDCPIQERIKFLRVGQNIHPTERKRQNQHPVAKVCNWTSRLGF